MKRLLIIIVLLALTTGCACKGMIRASEIEPLLEQVRERHDAYVEADEALSDLEKRTYLRSTEVLMEEVVNVALEKEEATEIENDNE